jgi:hypothetical protein
MLGIPGYGLAEAFFGRIDWSLHRSTIEFVAEGNCYLKYYGCAFYSSC